MQQREERMQPGEATLQAEEPAMQQGEAILPDKFVA
jgi:hypothetical protein